jgi:SAM-dependent methyltransferase
VAAGKNGADDYRVLNVASGPGSDMAEWLGSNQRVTARFDCVELDANAIAFAMDACQAHLDRVTFHRANALKFRTEARFHLCWSSGLFDYLSDSLFVRLLRTMIAHAMPGGEVVIGNFGSFNPSRHYMELLGDWVLEHRSPEHLRELALEAGAAEPEITIGREPACVNLFLHVRKPLHTL